MNVFITEISIKSVDDWSGMWKIKNYASTLMYVDMSLRKRRKEKEERKEGRRRDRKEGRKQKNKEIILKDSVKKKEK